MTAVTLTPTHTPNKSMQAGNLNMNNVREHPASAVDKPSAD